MRLTSVVPSLWLTLLARAVSVDSRAIIEALKSIYSAGRLVNELTGR
jgi:Peptidase S46